LTIEQTSGAANTAELTQADAQEVKATQRVVPKSKLESTKGADNLRLIELPEPLVNE